MNTLLRVELTAQLIQHSSGQKTDLSVSILSVENKEEIDVLLIELELPEMEPGKSLEIEAEELFPKTYALAISYHGFEDALFY